MGHPTRHLLLHLGPDLHAGHRHPVLVLQQKQLEPEIPHLLLAGEPEQQRLDLHLVPGQQGHARLLPLRDCGFAGVLVAVVEVVLHGQCGGFLVLYHEEYRGAVCWVVGGCYYA